MKNKIKILIADDNASMRQTLQEILIEKEYAAETIQNGYELLIYLKEISAERCADMIILDIMMPGRSGIELLSTIRSVSPRTKIIIYTGLQRYKHSIYANAADKFVLKDGNTERLLEAVEELAEQIS